MEQINLNQFENDLTKKLTAIINSPVMSDGLKNKQTQLVIEKELNILNFLMKKNETKISNLDILVNKYKEVSKSTFSVNQYIKYDDNDTLIDDIHYLDVYIKNIYKIDVESLLLGKIQKIITPGVSESKSQDTKNNIFGLSQIINKSSNISSDANPYLISLANIRLNEEIRKGDIYAFKTKPKWMPLIKYCIVGFSFLASICCLLIGIGLITSKSSPAVNNFLGTDGVDDLTWLGTMFIIFTFSMLVVAYSVLKPMLITINKKKNDNFLFYLQWQNIAFMLGIFCLFIAISFLSDTKSMVAIFNIKLSDVGPILWFVGYILLFSSIVFLIVLLILGRFFNPKSDKERLEGLIKQYMSEIGSNQPTQ